MLPCAMRTGRRARDSMLEISILTLVCFLAIAFVVVFLVAISRELHDSKRRRARAITVDECPQNQLEIAAPRLAIQHRGVLAVRRSSRSAAWLIGFLILV